MTVGAVNYQRINSEFGFALPKDKAAK